jgi:hypothetical protein
MPSHSELFGIKASLDLLIVIVIFGAGILYGIFAGRNRLILIILATYLALVMQPILPYAVTLKKGLDSQRAFAVDIGVFLALMIIFSVLLKRSVVKAVLRTPKLGDGGFVQIAIFSILASGLILTYSYSFLPLPMKRETNSFLRGFIFSDEARFWWTIIPLGGLLLIRKKEGER